MVRIFPSAPIWKSAGLLSCGIFQISRVRWRRSTKLISYTCSIGVWRLKCCHYQDRNIFLYDTWSKLCCMRITVVLLEVNSCIYRGATVYSTFGCHDLLFLNFCKGDLLRYVIAHHTIKRGVRVLFRYTTNSTFLSSPRNRNTLLLPLWVIQSRLIRQPRRVYSTSKIGLGLHHLIRPARC